ncbi:MAG TPA: helix-turn-helix domain-containing protein [Polyangiaceae bacterium]|nr:helix-turn-helix domain-containing protein [Polyangiaceae bacterium]
MIGPHALLSPVLANLFEELRVGAALLEGKEWRPIHTVPNVISFELQYGVERERDKYNARSLAEVRRERKPVLGSHAGFSDWFVPIVVGERLVSTLVTGPFATARPTSAELMERFRSLSGRQGHPSDPEFSHYLSLTLSALVLGPTEVAIFERLLRILARLMAGEARAPALLAQADKLRAVLERARFVERTWDAVRSMVDERTCRLWSRPALRNALRQLGLPRPPDQIMVGLVVRQRELEPVEEVLRHDAFQRACVKLARSSGQAICGQVGEHGVIFVCGETNAGKPRRPVMLGLGDKAATLAQSFGFRLHLGQSSLPSSASASEQYQAALAAAESALSQGARMVNATPSSARSKPALSDLRQKLAELVEQRPGAVSARFDRYLEAVAQHTGHRLELSRAHLEVGFERVAEPLLELGTLERKSFDDMRESLEQAAREARTLSDLFAAYRRVVADMIDAVLRPVPAHRERSLRRALSHLRKHYSEPLSLAAVARVAGFAPNYFSLLFKRQEKTTFEQYLRRLRLERAKQLLTTTDLDAARVAELSGFGTRQYMARVFRSSLGMTPSQCRQRSSRELP